MNSLEVNAEQITFNYQNKGHLPSSIVITNHHDAHAYFKFKVTRPKYYLIKPDSGFVEAHSSVTICVSLHQDGVNQGENDKLKMYYKFIGHSLNEPTKGWDKEELDVMHIRFTVVINNLPEEHRKVDARIKNSDVKSLSSSKFGVNGRSSLSTIQNSINEKQGKLSNLKNQVEELKNHTGKLTKSSSGIKEYLIVGGIGIILGLLSSFWI